MGLSLGLRLPWVWWRFVNLMVEVCSFSDLYKYGLCYMCKVINGKDNKTMKIKPVSAKTSSSYSEK